MGSANAREMELFLDSHRISWEYNVARRLQHPLRYHANPILEPQYPWEQSFVTIYGSVLPRAGGGFRMWYMAGAGGMRSDQSMCYAESDDGLAWSRVMSDDLSYRDQRPTNVVLGPEINVHGPCVIENRHNDDPAQRYLVLFDSYPDCRPELKDQLQESRWTYSAVSANGLQWQPPAGRPAMPGKSDIGQSVVWDESNHRYIAYLRGTRGDPGVSLPGPDRACVSQRYVRAAVSSDFAHWSEPVEVFRCDALDGDPYHQAHQLSVTRRGTQFIGLLSIFRVLQIKPAGEIRRMEDGPIDTQMIVSRDGFSWNRVADRQTFFPMGAPGQWDSHWLVTASQIVYDGDRMLFYYASTNVPRGGLPAYDHAARSGSRYRIGVATLPRDRYQALAPHRLDQPAVIETKPLAFNAPDGELMINADAAHGRIEIELCDFNGQVIEGFSTRDCNPIEQDGLSQPVRWNNRRLTDAVDHHKIFQRSIRIRFYLHRASLFAAEIPAIQEQSVDARFTRPPANGAVQDAATFLPLGMAVVPYCRGRQD